MALSTALSAFSVFSNKNLREPEIHLIGEIVGASGLTSDNAFCVFQVKTGRYWSCVGGEEEGQTQTDYPSGENDMINWNHPLDLHYFTKTVEGWPKLIFEVWTLDSYGGKSLAGYGFMNLPSSPGTHEIESMLWRPCGTHREELGEFFLQDSVHLLNHEVLHNTVKAKEDRHRLTTKYAGKVHVRVDVVMRHMKDHNVST